MAEFHTAVSTLLDAFAHGITTIKTQKSRRPKHSSSSGSASEKRLSKSLKKNRNEVKSAYDRDLDRFGSGFAVGDDEARTSLAGILTRLTTGFLSIFNRFLRGKSTASDYQTLLSLSDVSRRETIRTFDQLSERLSNSSLALVTEKEKDYSKKRKKGHTSTSKSTTASRTAGSKGSKALRVKKSKTKKDGAVTPLGMATSSGWIRQKPTTTTQKKRTSKSSSRSSSVSPKPPLLEAPPPILTPPSSPPPRYELRPQSKYQIPQSKYEVYQIPQLRPDNISPLDIKRPLGRREVTLGRKEVNRKSFMSFESDSTKLGEIPEYKWSKPPGVGGKREFEVQPFFPLGGVVHEPAKKSRLRRFFGRS